ncbi:hypothetical protein DXG01_002960 [Tephrocybe rancida]|nr:hypothetical protein DXG01_002960 [Tephrocybe rancida]
MTDTANPTASDNQTAASGLPPPPGEAPLPLPGNEQHQDMEMDLTSTGTAVTQAPTITQPAPAQQAPNISAPQPVAPVVSQMAPATAQGMPSIPHHQPAHHSDVQYYQPAGYQPLPQDSAPNVSIGCGADFMFTSIPGKRATTNKNLWYNENDKSYFYIDSKDKFNLLKRIHPITLKGFLVFDCVLCKCHEDGLPLELQVPCGYLEFVHIINKDRTCSWGMMELDMERQDWIVGKREAKIDNLKIEAPMDWEFRKLMEVMSWCTNLRTQKFDMDMVDRLLDSYNITEGLKVELQKVEFEWENYRRQGQQGRNMGPSPLGMSPGYSVASSLCPTLHASNYPTSTAGTAGGNFWGHCSISPAFSKSDYAGSEVRPLTARMEATLPDIRCRDPPTY